MGNVGLFSPVTIGANGLGLITDQDASYQDVLIAHRACIACTVAAKMTDADDFLLFSYCDSTHRSPKVMHRENPFCAPFFRRR